jgi:3-oxoacyl-[acyl-carrier-protein] synthase II
MKAIIKASSIISPQPTNNTEGFPEDILEVISDRLACVEPEYRTLINPIQLRRMPRILKMGLAASQMCINRAGGVEPDGIIVGTGLGCLDNLEKFLMEVLDTNEHVTSVLPFINSTHNAVAAQIALLLKNHSYNVTYCHRGFSFESALQDALLLIADKHAGHVLVGGIDECTSDFMHLHNYLGYWKKPLSNLQLLSENSTGTIAGEGAAFFMLEDGSKECDQVVTIEGVHTFLLPDGARPAEVMKETEGFLKNLQVEKKEISVLLLGMNGDNRYDGIYQSFAREYFTPAVENLYYKHLCGEYYTSGAFALWLGSVVLQNQTIPDVIRLKKGKQSSLKYLLIYNNIRNTEHSLMLLRYGQF